MHTPGDPCSDVSLAVRRMSKALKPGRHDQTSIFGLPLHTKQRHTSYQHSSANLPTLLRQQGSYRALRHSPTKETQAPTSEKKPKPFLSLSAVRKVRPGKHEGGLRGQLRGTDATTGATGRLPAIRAPAYLHNSRKPVRTKPQKPSEHQRAAGRRF